jgi:hypothetical protein
LTFIRLLDQQLDAHSVAFIPLFFLEHLDARLELKGDKGGYLADSYLSQ